MASPDQIVAVDFPDYDVGSGDNTIPYLGHAGVLLINGTSGLTKYFEYGRYDEQNRGIVVRRTIPNVTMSGGQPTQTSLAAVLQSITSQSGHNGRILAAAVRRTDSFTPALNHCTAQQALNSDASRPAYDPLTRNCMHFVKDVIEATGADTPLMIDPRPNSYIDELRDDYPNIDYDPQTGTITIGP